MMKLVESLEEIREYGRMLAKLPTKAVRAIPDDEVLNFYLAANKFVPEELERYAQLYDFPDYKGASVKCLKGAAGLCSHKNEIRIDFLHLLFADDVTFTSTLLHELCHTKIHNHTVSFWELLDKKLKEASIIDKNDDSRKKWLKRSELINLDGDFLYDSPWELYENVSVIKSSVVRRKICLDSCWRKVYFEKNGNMCNLLYNVNYEGKYPWMSDEVQDALMIPFRDKQLTTFDWADMKQFLMSGQVFEVYTSYGNGNAKADAIDDVLKKSKLTKMRDVCMILLIFSLKDGSSIQMSDIHNISDKIHSVNSNMLFVFTENPELEEDKLYVQLLLARM